MNSDSIVKCYHCNNDMNFDHYIICDGKCYWCWECSETQYIDLNNVMRPGHNIIPHPHVM